MRLLWERTRRDKSFEHIEDDKLKSQFYVVALKQCWMSDYNYIPSRESWLHVAVIMNVYSRVIVGDLSDSLVIKAVV